MATSEWIVKKPRLLLFGDSLTDRGFEEGGWAACLAHLYSRRADVVARGFGGYNTTLAQFLVEEVFSDCTASNTLLAAVWFGANDAARPLPLGTAHSSRQHTPVAQYRENLRSIITVARSRGVSRLLLITPPPVYEPGRKAHQRRRMGDAIAEGMTLDRTNDYTRQYADAVKDVAWQEGVPFADLWSAMQSEDDWGERLLSDGLHFTPQGQQAAFAVVKQALLEGYPELSPDALPVHYPPWEAFDAGPLSKQFCHPPRK